MEEGTRFHDVGARGVLRIIDDVIDITLRQLHPLAAARDGFSVEFVRPGFHINNTVGPVLFTVGGGVHFDPVDPLFAAVKQGVIFQFFAEIIDDVHGIFRHVIGNDRVIGDPVCAADMLGDFLFGRSVAAVSADTRVPSDQLIVRGIIIVGHAVFFQQAVRDDGLAERRHPPIGEEQAGIGFVCEVAADVCRIARLPRSGKNICFAQHVHIFDIALYPFVIDVELDHAVVVDVEHGRAGCVVRSHDDFDRGRVRAADAECVIVAVGAVRIDAPVIFAVAEICLQTEERFRQFRHRLRHVVVIFVPADLFEMYFVPNERIVFHGGIAGIGNAVNSRIAVLVGISDGIPCAGHQVDNFIQFPPRFRILQQFGKIEECAVGDIRMILRFRQF